MPINRSSTTGKYMKRRKESRVTSPIAGQPQMTCSPSHLKIRHRMGNEVVDHQGRRPKARIADGADQQFLLGLSTASTIGLAGKRHLCATAGSVSWILQSAADDQRLTQRCVRQVFGASYFS